MQQRDDDQAAAVRRGVFIIQVLKRRPMGAGKGCSAPEMLAWSKPLTYNSCVKIAWESAKDLANRKKHGVSFEEASALFKSGRDYLEIFDEAHSDDEDRFIAIGPIVRGLVLVVYTEREEDTLRIISARWATPREKQMYRSYKGGYP